jgi:hypothetical protein
MAWHGMAWQTFVQETLDLDQHHGWEAGVKSHCLRIRASFWRFHTTLASRSNGERARSQAGDDGPLSMSAPSSAHSLDQRKRAYGDEP